MWDALGWDKSRQAILRELTEGQIPSDDRASPLSASTPMRRRAASSPAICSMRAAARHSHPLDKSFCQALADTAANTLIEVKHECRRVNLYRSQFSPLLTPAERASYYASFDASEVTKEIEDLLWAEVIVLVFPTWWFGPPAILKGWFDRFGRLASRTTTRPILAPFSRVCIGYGKWSR